MIDEMPVTNLTEIPVEMYQHMYKDEVARIVRHAVECHTCSDGAIDAMPKNYVYGRSTDYQADNCPIRVVMTSFVTKEYDEIEFARRAWVALKEEVAATGTYPQLRPGEVGRHEWEDFQDMVNYPVAVAICDQGIIVHAHNSTLYWNIMVMVTV